MDYARLSEKSLDDIMQNIRIETGKICAEKTSVVHVDEKRILGQENDFQVMNMHLAEAVIGKQIGLHKGPMHKKHGIMRWLARLVEKIYLRMAELTNRDVRTFNTKVLDLFHEIKRKLEAQHDLHVVQQVQIDEMMAMFDNQKLKILDLNEQVVVLRSVVRWANNMQFTKVLETKGGDSPLDNPIFYHDFEEKFRGTRDEIKDRLTVYLPKVNVQFGDWTDKTFVDIGTGRGEWLDLLKEHGVTNYIGVDLNDVQLNICREYGHPVVLADCVAYLSELPHSSVDMITGFQIIEHLPLDALLALLAQSNRVLKKNGMVLFETPNPSNLLTAATYFNIDPTHNRPLHKDVVSFYMEKSGFAEVSIMEVNPALYSRALVSPISIDGNQEVWDMNVDMLNNLLYGAQDYAAMGIKK